LYYTGTAIVWGLGPADETEINDLTPRVANVFGPSVGLKLQRNIGGVLRMTYNWMQSAHKER
jgi:hypothetical protein